VSQYAQISDLFLYGLREEARADIPDAVLTANLVSASAMVDGYLVGRYGVGSMPLVSWDTEITMWTAWIAVYLILSGPRGYAPNGADDNIRQRYDDAKAMLARTQRQDYHPILVPRTAQGSTAIQPLVISYSVVNLATGATGANRGW
jgi:phage gp36-like protein